MVDVFISYSRSNQPVVRQLAESVKALGYSVWWDDELPPHLSYSDVITDKIGAAKAAIVVWSEGAAASEWVRAEADLARAQKKLIQTSLDGRMPPMPFNQIQFATIGDWKGEEDHPGWKKVKASLEALCGAPGGQGPAPAPAPLPAAAAPPAAAPAPASQSALLVPALVGLLLLAVLIVGYLLWPRGGGMVTVQNQVATPTVAPPPVVQVPALAPAPEAPPPRAQPDGTFTQAATIDDPDGYTNVRGGPSADAFVLGRVNRGEVFTTYPQDGSWWRVRTAAGTVGYMARSRIRLLSAEAPLAAPAQGAAQATSQASAVPDQDARNAEPQVLRMPFNPRRYCNGPGRDTAECARLRQRPRQGGNR